MVNTSNVSILVVINQIVSKGNNGPAPDVHSMPHTEVAVMASDIISLLFESTNSIWRFWNNLFFFFLNKIYWNNQQY